MGLFDNVLQKAPGFSEITESSQKAPGFGEITRNSQNYERTVTFEIPTAQAKEVQEFLSELNGDESPGLNLFA